ncbi:heterokaryon incompatibility protein-domain-containing protein [Halenospora varia]|nr:heterokaryon incompatibility protein-domain-containing protein [Halenospora varia]
MPHANESRERTKLQCELFEYSLQDLGKRTHLYEALSYTWGGEKKPCSITIKEQNLDITTNLYAIDAICINQKNPEEQGQQVQLIAMIYSKAHHVLVWLGEMADDIEGALEDIQHAANEESTGRSNKKMNKKAIFNLLQRQWFQRIWVLQEVAAARHVIMICGSTEIDGYAFCLGLKSFRKSQTLSYTAFPKLQSLPLLITLIEQAGLRPKHTTNSLERYSLQICSLAELVDMFYTRQASNPYDKQLVKFILGKDVSVETSSQRAVIRSKGCILGQVSLVRGDGRQNVSITFRKADWDLGGKTEWTLQASAKPIQEGDIICLLYGASKPTIIRPDKGHFAVIIIVATPLTGSSSFKWPETSQSTTQFLRDFLLIWDWENPLGKLQDQEEYKTLTRTYR